MMLSTSAFRVLLAIAIAVNIVGVIVGMATEARLPPLLQLYLEGWYVVDFSHQQAGGSGAERLSVELEWAEWPATAGEAVAGVLFLLLVPVGIATWVGLFLLKAWGAWLALTLTVLVLLIAPLMPAITYTGWAGGFYELATLLHGVILAVIFVGPMRRHFFDGNQPARPRPVFEGRAIEGPAP